jgi:chromosomal replication initiation ATPase DnaA
MTERRRPRVREIIALVAAHFQITIDDLQSPSHAHRLVLIRWISMRLADQYTPMSRNGIARLHKRDHSSMLHGMRKLSALLADGRSPLCRHIAKLEAQLWEGGFMLDPPVARPVLQRLSPAHLAENRNDLAGSDKHA